MRFQKKITEVAGEAGDDHPVATEEAESEAQQEPTTDGDGAKVETVPSAPMSGASLSDISKASGIVSLAEKQKRPRRVLQHKVVVYLTTEMNEGHKLDSMIDSIRATALANGISSSVVYDPQSNTTVKKIEG